MKVLIIGGNRFLGLELTFRLLAQGHVVTLLNRGNLPHPFRSAVEHLTCDRSSAQFEVALAGRTFDAVVDFALFNRAAADQTARVLAGRVGHYVMLSTGQVYLVRAQYSAPATEESYAGELLPPPPSGYDLEQWSYGVDKRGAEDAIAESALPSTRLRIPMVHGGRDYYRRIESVLHRVLDGGPILITNAEAPCRHVYGPAVVRAIERLLMRGPTGEAYNFCQREQVTVREFVALIARQLGARPELRSTTYVELTTVGLDPILACPFSGRWMSCLDETKARQKLGLTHEPLEEYLPATVEALLARWPMTPPPSMDQRVEELALAKRLA